MAKLMHDHIFLRRQRHHTEPPRKGQRAGAQAARPPAGGHVPHGDFGHTSARAAGRELRIVYPAKRLHMGQCVCLCRQFGALGLLALAPDGGPGLCAAHPIGPCGHKGIHIAYRHPHRRTGRHRTIGPHAQVDIAHPPPRQCVGNAPRRALLHLLCRQTAAPFFIKNICNIVHAFAPKCKQKGGHAARLKFFRICLNFSPPCPYIESEPTDKLQTERTYLL